MSDYNKMRIMELAGIKSGNILNEGDEEAFKVGIEKNIRLIARQTGVELWDSHAITILEDNTCEMRVDTKSGMPVSHLLHFANKLASAGIGSDVQVHGSTDLHITLTFNLV